MTEIATLTDLAKRVAAVYTDSFGVAVDSRWLLHKMTEELGELHGAWMGLNGQSRKVSCQQDLADEVADLFGSLLLFAEAEGIDPAEALRSKWGAHLPTDRLE